MHAFQSTCRLHGLVHWVIMTFCLGAVPDCLPDVTQIRRVAVNLRQQTMVCWWQLFRIAVQSEAYLSHLILSRPAYTFKIHPFYAISVGFHAYCGWLQCYCPCGPCTYRRQQCKQCIPVPRLSIVSRRQPQRSAFGAALLTHWLVSLTPSCAYVCNRLVTYWFFLG